jgi:hypothetical protein
MERKNNKTIIGALRRRKYISSFVVSGEIIEWSYCFGDRRNSDVDVISRA